MKYYLFYT